MALRPESSVSVDLDEYGQVAFRSDLNGAVIHRTPEELGIPSVIAAAPPRAKRPERTEAEIEHARKQLGKAPLRTIGGEPVRLPPGAVMGAEMLNESEEAKVQGRVEGVSEEVGIAIVSEPPTVSNAELARRFDLTEYKVCKVRAQAGIRSQAKPPGRNADAGNAEYRALAEQKPKPKSVPRSIEIDPQRAGTAAALLGALAKQDAAAERVKIELELSAAEIGVIVGRLDAVQRQAFFAAGIRAALLAK